MLQFLAIFDLPSAHVGKMLTHLHPLPNRPLAYIYTLYLTVPWLIRVDSPLTTRRLFSYFDIEK